jgi:hypothetical protein
MKIMTAEEARDWCLKVGLKWTSEGVLRYSRSAEHRFLVLAPEEFRLITVFSRGVLIFRGEAVFSGGLLWLRRWNIGSSPMVRVGWRTLENIRRAHGDSRSLEVAPAQLFREDEFLELHAFLVQVIGFGWLAEFVPSTGGFFAHFKDNRQVCFTAESKGSLDELRASLSRWNPTDEDPMVKRLAEMEKERNARRVVRS